MSLRLRLVLLNTSLIVLVAVLYSAITLTEARDGVHRMLRTRVDAHLTSMCALATLPMQVSDTEGLRALADTALDGNEIMYCVFEDVSGNPVAVFGDAALLESAQEDVADDAAEGRWLGKRVGEETYEFSKPIVAGRAANDDLFVLGEADETELVGRVRLGVSTKRNAEVVSTIAISMFLIATVFVVVAAAIGVWGTNRLLAPIRRMTDATKEVAGGRFGMRVPVSGGAEVAVLAESFNKMTDALDNLVRDVQEKSTALSGANEEIRRANAELESRVKERTAELARANERLNTEIADKNDFLRTVSHDMGAPLRNVLGMVDSITRRHGEGLSSEVKDRLARIRRNAEKELGLIDELLELSRIHSRRERRGDVEVGAVVREVVEGLSSDLEAKSIRVDIGEAWPTIWCERARLTQVFQNLVDNAAKYMGGEDGRVSIEWRDEPERHVFLVSDNGVGIPADEQERIFYVFRRAKNTLANVDGKGVGLAAVKAIVGTYRGDVWVESQEGSGSTFHFSLSKGETTRPTGDGADDVQRAG